MGAYIEPTDLYDEFGQTNVLQWADHDSLGDEATITATIERAIAYAEQYVTDRLRNGRYAIPLAEIEPGGLSVVKATMAQIAGCKLYSARGLRDDAVEDRMQLIRNKADETISAYQSGQMNLGAAKRTNIVGAPTIVG